MSLAFDTAMDDAVLKRTGTYSRAEKEAFKVGFRRGWWRKPKDDPHILSPRDYPAAYNAGYWEGHGASTESLF